MNRWTRLAATLLLLLGVARAAGGIVLLAGGPGAVGSDRVDEGTARALGGGLILVGAVAVAASVGLLRGARWGVGLSFAALALFIAGGLVNGSLLFGRPGDRGTIVNLVAAGIIGSLLVAGICSRDGMRGGGGDR